MLRQLIEISEEEYEKAKQEVDNREKHIEEAIWGEFTKNNYEILNNYIDEFEKDLIK